MRARIEAAQKRRSQRRARCICFWSFTLAGLVAGGFLLRGKPVPVVSVSQSAHKQVPFACASPSPQIGLKKRISLLPAPYFGALDGPSRNLEAQS